jgi:4-diphosphocytidyl-2-C-methyl-D-erythritol kinase
MLARAKINLALHVTGQRADGYHLLDSLVCFADVGDRITARASAHLTLSISGPFAPGVPGGTGNLVLQAAQTFGADKGAAVTLEKNLPPASGIGGGSADAAAALHVLADLWSLPLPGPAQLLALGADVPVCVAGHPTRMSGIGDVLHPVSSMPQFPAVLVNPGLPVATPDVFRALSQKQNPPLAEMPDQPDPAAWLTWLAGQRNDLQAPACQLVPEIRAVLDALCAMPTCTLARMSGSGGTCFGLFQTAEQAASAAQNLSRNNPDWWVQACTLNAPEAS